MSEIMIYSGEEECFRLEAPTHKRGSLRILVYDYRKHEVKTFLWHRERRCNPRTYGGKRNLQEKLEEALTWITQDDNISESTLLKTARSIKMIIVMRLKVLMIQKSLAPTSTMTH